MIAETETRAVTSLADATAVLRYAQSVMPLVMPPRFDGVNVKFEVHAHRIPVEILHAMLAVNDDLPWTVERYEGRDGSTEWWALRLDLTWCHVILFSGHHEIGSVHGPAEGSA